MRRACNIIKKNNKAVKASIVLITILIFIMIMMQASFAADKTIDNSTDGGILGAINNETVNNGDTITLQQGTYNKTNQDTNITINKNITLKGNGTVYIDANKITRIFTIANNINITFINIIFTNGYTDTGGAIYNQYRTTRITIINCTFTQNTATNDGGAIYNYNGNFSVINSTFNNNTATTSGGAIQNYNGGNFTVTNSTFNYNIANSGGAIYNYGGNFTVTNSTFNNNTAKSDAGAIQNYNRGNFTVTNSTFNNNTATNYGGAISNTAEGNFTVSNSNFTNNTSLFGGGAIYNDNSNFTVTNSTFNNNTATTSGGVLYNYNGNFSVANSTFNNNTATSSGGAIYNSGDEFIIFGSGFNGNIAGVGGGVFTTTKISIMGCNFTNNSQAIGLNTADFLLKDNNIINNSIGIQFILNNLNYTIEGLSSNNNIRDNLFAVAISGSFTNYTVSDNFGYANNGGFIFTANSNNNTLLYGDFSGYTRPSFGSNGIAIMFNTSANNNRAINSNITNNDFGIVVNSNNAFIISCNIFNNSRGILINSSARNTTINYNRIFKNTIYELNNTGTNSNANYNWWGTNTPTKIINITPENYFIMSVSNITSLNSNSNGIVIFNYIFKLNTDEEADNNLLPYFETNIYNNLTKDFINNFDARFNKTINITLNPSTKEHNITFILDDEIQTITIYASSKTNNLDITVENGTYNQNITISAKLTDEYGDPIVGETIDFYITINGTLIYLGSGITNFEGVASIRYHVNSTGNYLITAIFNETIIYSSARTNAAVIFYPQKTTVTSNHVKAVVGSEIRLVGTLKGQFDGALANRVVDFYIDGVYVGSNTTNSQGIAYFTYLINSLGTFKYTVSFTDLDDNYVSSESDAVIEIKIINIKLDVVITESNSNRNITILAKLTDEYGKPIIGETITFYINHNGAVIYVKSGTNFEGIAVYNYFAKTGGNLTLQAIFNGIDGDYIDSNILSLTFLTNENTVITNNTTSKNNNSTTTSVTKISQVKTTNTYQRVKKMLSYTKLYQYKNSGKATGSKNFTYKFAKNYKVSNIKTSAGTSYSYNKKTNTLTFKIKNLAYNKYAQIQFKISKTMKRDIKTYKGLNKIKESITKQTLPNKVILTKSITFKNFFKTKPSKSFTIKIGKAKLYNVKKTKYTTYTYKKASNSLKVSIKKLPKNKTTMINYKTTQTTAKT